MTLKILCIIYTHHIDFLGGYIMYSRDILPEFTDQLNLLSIAPPECPIHLHELLCTSECVGRIPL